MVGINVGFIDGENDGDFDGWIVGFEVVGWKDGEIVGIKVGINEGKIVGRFEGLNDGWIEGK